MPILITKKLNTFKEIERRIQNGIRFQWLGHEKRFEMF